jgi:hypothetical protein
MREEVVEEEGEEEVGADPEAIYILCLILKIML